MNAFGSALSLGFMRGSWDFSSGSMPMDSISGCIPMSSYSSANGLNLRLHSHEFLSPCQWISDCIPMSSYSLPMNLKTAFPWVPISLPMNLWMLEFKFLFPCQWISDCIPMSSSPIPKPMNLRLHSHESLFPCKIFGVFWLGTTHVLPSWFRNAPRRSKNRILARFWVYPYTYHMGIPKIDCRAF